MQSNDDEIQAAAMPETNGVAAAATSTSTAVVAGATRGRKRAHGSGRKQKQSLRTPVTFAHKREVLAFYDAHEQDMQATVLQFYSDLSASAMASRKRQIYKWVKTRSVIEEMCFKTSTARQTRRREKGTATTLNEEAEQELVQWIGAQTQIQQQQWTTQVDADSSSNSTINQEPTLPLSMQAFRAKAMEIADKYNVPPGSFRATWTWQQAFFKRHHFV